jgi:peptidoglycan hydrolase-like protein with peptidoglycan-binding domain
MAVRRRALLAAGGVLAVVAGVAVVLLTRNPAGPGKPAQAGTVVRYATVERTDIAMTTSLDGTLGYGTERPVKGSGHVTWLPRAGVVVSRGQPLFRADDQPVILLYGDTPLFRPLTGLGTVGRDVKVLADNLKALGYRVGQQPGAGSRIAQGPAAPAPATQASSAQAKATPGPAPVEVRPGDAVFTASLANALKRWQAHAGLPATGVLDPGRFVVLPGAARVNAVTTQLGDDASAPVLTVTGTAKVVTVQVEATEADAVRSAEHVTVTLPDGASVPGRVAQVSRTATAAAQDGDSSGPVQLTATVTMNNPAKARAFDSAPVQVQFAAHAHSGVLVVPVGALLALSEGGYAMQTDRGTLIPVTTGLFDRGRVEVSGAGLRPGLRVVTTS